MKKRRTNGKRSPQPQEPRPLAALTEIAVRGFKSHRGWTQVELRPLTILAGENSSGKSGVMQPLLLLKQTVDALPYNPGPLKLDGPHVHFTDARQFLWEGDGSLGERFDLRIGTAWGEVGLAFREDSSTVRLAGAAYTSGGGV